jgi:nucleoside-triphosphatase
VVTTCRDFRRVVVTGARGAGKTTFCRRLAELAREADREVAGILSLPRIEKGTKTGILACSLRSGETRLLASARAGEVDGFRFCNWHFSEAVMRWSNEALSQAVPCDLLIIDEIGRLELDSGRGLVAGFEVMDGPAHSAVVITVRLGNEERLLQRWPGSSRLLVTTAENARDQAASFLAEMAGSDHAN